MRRPLLVAASSLLFLTGNAECENVETCTPTRVAIEFRDSGYVVSLHSGDQALRGRTVRVQAVDAEESVFRTDVEVDRQGEARVGIPADARAASDEVVASFSGDRTYCPSGDATDDGTGV